MNASDLKALLDYTNDNIYKVNNSSELDSYERSSELIKLQDIKFAIEQKLDEIIKNNFR